MSREPGIRETESGFFCGPTAIAAISDKTPAQVCAIVNAYRNKPARTKVRSMWTYELQHVLLEIFGNAVRSVTFSDGQRPTIYKYVETHAPTLGVIWSSNHFLAIDGRRIADTKCRFPVDVACHPYKNKRVKRIYVILK